MADSKNIQQEPCSTLLYDYELTTCDLLNSDETCEEVCQFLNVHRVSEGGGITFEPNCSMKLLRWLLCPPGYYEDWHLGVRDKISKELIGFIGGVPVPMRVMGSDVDVPTAMIKCFCVHKLYGNDVASVMFAGMSERVESKGVRQAMHGLGSEFDRPGVVICSYTTMMRNLNPDTLVDDELPDDTVTPGFIEMEKDDIKGVKDLLNDINSDKQIGLSWDDDTIEHMFLPKEDDDLIHSYVVKDHRTSDITDFCSFYTTPLTVVEIGEKTTMECAISFCIGARATNLTQLMNDMLIAAQQTGVDMFYSSDMGEDENFWKELKFVEGLKRNYYILDANGIGNYPLTLSEIGIGIVLW